MSNNEIILSIVTTAFNEAGNVHTFLSSVSHAIKVLGIEGEIIYFDDGSDDGTGDNVTNFVKQHPQIKIHLIKHTYRLGITTAIQESIEIAQGRYLCFLPADLESLPQDDIPLLYHALDKDTDVVVGCRKGRADGKLFASRFYNLLNYLLFNVKLHDANWIKLIRREKLADLKLRSDWHRFLIPILAYKGCRFKEVETKWHPRSFGKSNFGIKRFPGALVDLISLKLHFTFGQRPLLLFSYLSILSFSISTIPLAIVLLNTQNTSIIWFASWILFGIFSVAGLMSIIIGIAVQILMTDGPYQK